MDYFILKPNGEQTGTYSLDQIREMLKTGFVGADTCYWHDGITEWQPIERIDDSLNFAAASTKAGEKALPPPHRLKGSLARAIPSPQQQKRPSSASVASPLPERKQAPPAHPGPVEAHLVSLPTSAPYLNGKPDVSSVDSAPGVQAALPSSSVPVSKKAALLHRLRQWKSPVSARYLLYALPATLLALAIIAAVIASRHPARSPLSKVTITDRNVYVLLAQPKIKAFEDAMRTSPVAAALVRQIAQSNDPVFIQRMSVGLQKETTQHRVEVTQHFLEAGDAKVIDPGTYDALSYFDDTGAIIVPRVGDPWVAILYRGNIVFAYQGTEFVLKSQ